MKIKWQIFAIILLLFVASCSKDNDKMDGELIIEDLKVGEGAPVEKYNIVTVNYTGWLTDDTNTHPLERPAWGLTHMRHPCTIWTNDSYDNYVWHWRLGVALCHEYTKRYKAFLLVCIYRAF